MTEDMLEKQLRRYYGRLASEAPSPTLRRDVSTIPDRIVVPARRGLSTRSFALLAAAALMTMVIGGGLIAGGGWLRREAVAPPVSTSSIQPSLLPTPTSSSLPTASPAVARNGLIAYVTRKGGNTQPFYVHLVNPDGSNDRQFDHGTDPAFTHDGQLFFARAWWPLDGSPELVLADRDGANQHVITNKLSDWYELAPDGTSLVVGPDYSDQNEPADLTLVNVADGLSRVLVAADSDVVPTSPAWSPDGHTVAYCMYRPAGDGSSSGVGISVVDVQTGDVRELTDRMGACGISWSPDGRLLAYTAVPDDQPEPSPPPAGASAAPWFPPQDIFVIRADGTGDTNITNSPGEEGAPEWAPDGTSIAYQAFVDNEGSFLSIVDLDGLRPAAAPRRFPSMGGFVWSPDATQLLISHVTSTRDGTQVDDVYSLQLIGRDLVGSPSTIVEAPTIVDFAWQRLPVTGE